MPLDLRAAVELARLPSPWDAGNEVLYDLCTRHPFHTEVPAVIAKVWLIGRSYAAAIERRRNKADEENDDFYVKKVGPEIVRSEIDIWIKAARQYERPSTESFGTLLEVHHRTTLLFREISGLEKRSLASKYLHFHVPSLFYIYDTRAVEALRELSAVVGRAGRATVPADNEYRRFSEKCLSLQQHIEKQFDVWLTPRDIDKLLLEVHAKNKPSRKSTRTLRDKAAPRRLLLR